MDRKLLFQGLVLASLCHVLLATAHHTQEQLPAVPVTIQNYNIQGPVQLTHGNAAGKSEYKPSQPHAYSPVAPYADAQYQLREPTYVITAYKAELRHPQPLGAVQKAERPYFLPPYYQAPVFNAPVYQQHPTYPHVPFYHAPVYVQQQSQVPYQGGANIYSAANQTVVEQNVEQSVEKNVEQNVEQAADVKPEMMAVIFNEEAFEQEAPEHAAETHVTSHLDGERQQVEQVEPDRDETGPAEKAVEAQSHRESKELARDDEKVVDGAPEPAEEVQAYKSDTEAPVDEEKLETTAETTTATEAIQELFLTTLLPQLEIELTTEPQESPETEATLIAELPTIGDKLSAMEPATENVSVTEVVAVEVATEAVTENSYTAIQEETTTETVLETQAANVEEELETVKVIELSATEYVPPVESANLNEQVAPVAVKQHNEGSAKLPPLELVPLIYRKKAEQKESNPVPSLVPLIYRAPEEKEPKQPVLVQIIYREQVEQKKPAEKAALEANNVAKRSDSVKSSPANESTDEPSESYSTTPTVEIVQSSQATTEAVKAVEESTTAPYEEKTEEKIESTTLKNTFRPSANRRKYKTTTTTTTTTTPLPPVRTRPNYSRNRKPWRAAEVAETTTEQPESVESDERDGPSIDESEKKTSLRKPIAKLNTKRLYPIVTKRPLAAGEARESYQSSREASSNPVQRSLKSGLHFPRRIETRVPVRRDEPTPSDHAREARRESEEVLDTASAESGQRERYVASGSVNKVHKVSQLMADEDTLTPCTFRKIKEALLSGHEDDLPDGAVYDRENNRVILPEGLVLHYLDESEELHDA